MTYVLDGAMMDTKKHAHQHMRDVMGFPAYYGNNLDALYDCLTELSGEIRLYHTAELRRALQYEGEKMLRVLKDAQSEGLKVTLAD